MFSKKSLFISLVTLGLGSIIGIASLSLAGAFDSEATPPTLVEGTAPSLTATGAPEVGDALTKRTAPTADTPIADTEEAPTAVIVQQPVTGAPPTEELATEEPPTATPRPEVPIIDPDPNFQEELDRAGFRFMYFWKRIDFSRHTVSLDEISSGGPYPDGIPSIDDPKFIRPLQANVWLRDPEPVISFELNGDARAYPLQILIQHEIVNDVVGGVPVVVTFCPLCNSAIVFERTMDGIVYDFGTTGNLRNSDLVMYDRQTQSWWQQFTGEGIVGIMAGRQLEFLPASIISWKDFKDAFSKGKVLSTDTGFPGREYGINPYYGYDRADTPPFLFDGILDGRLLPKERVVAVTIGDKDAAFPFTILEEERVVNYTVNGQDMVIFFQHGTQSALDSDLFGFSKDVGATGVFDPVLDGRKLTFSLDGERIVDDQTGSTWNIVGQATEGEHVGQTLTPIVHGNHFWFSWAAFKPGTLIYLGSS